MAVQQAQQAVWAEDVPALAGVSFGQAVGALRAACMPEIDEALFGLERVKCLVEAARIVKHYDPGDPLLGGTLGSTLQELLESPAQYWTVEERALEIVGELFPLHYAMEDQMLNLEPVGFSFDLLIEPQGTAWSFDDFDWYTSRPGEAFERKHSALIFGKYLDALVDEELYQEAAEYFGWPERVPLSLERPVESVDGEKLLDLLAKRGLDEFASVFRVVFQTTQNPFFDLSMEDIYTGGFEYTLEQVREFEGHWEAAQLVIEQLELASELALNDAGILERVLDAWDECTIFSKAQKRTLVEVFEEAEARERVIDPFYGPLDGIEDDGGDDDWDDEEGATHDERASHQEEAEDGEEEE